jgi:hypothetical protein
MNKSTKNIDWASVIGPVFKIVCVIAIFLALTYSIESCADSNEQSRQAIYNDAYDEGYSVGYDSGRERGHEDVEADPRFYDLYSYDNIIDMLDDLFDGNIPDDADWYLSH